MPGFAGVFICALTAVGFVVSLIAAQEISGSLHPGCVLGQFECHNGMCIDPVLLCNAEDDCGDHTDEFPVRHQCPRVLTPLQKVEIVLGCVVGIPMFLSIVGCVIMHCCPCGHKDVVCEKCNCCGLNPKQHARVHPIEDNEAMEDSPLQDNEPGQSSMRTNKSHIYIIEEDDEKLLLPAVDNLELAVV